MFNYYDNERTMETIEERAEEYAQRVFPCPNESKERRIAELAYESGARSQQKTDIEKACEWFRKENSHAVKEWLDYECEKLRAAMLND